MKLNLKLAGCLVMYVFVLAGCKKEADQPEGSEYFVSATSAGSFTKTYLQAAATAVGYGSFAPLIKYDVDFYRIVYKTAYKGNMIEVSGLLCIPKNTPAPPTLLSAQHGTMFKSSDAPTNFPLTFTGFELCAAAGFVTVIPDFIGFGSSKNVPQTYYDQKTSGTTVANMLEATKYYLNRENIAISNRLFLLGYSEGGYVTMAAQKEIETNPAHHLTLTAAVEGAGGYDLNGMLTTIAAAPSYDQPSFLALIIQSYNTTYSWNRPYTDFFQQPYASRIPTLLDGSKTGDEINAQLTNSPSALFNPTFFASLSNPNAELTLKQAIQDNSFLTWYPKSPTRMYHGTSDVTVFYQTSVTTYNKFVSLGATNVQFIPIPNGTHATSIQPMMLDALPWLQSLDK